MKWVISNKKGFRIHSPFVFNLITNVLFTEHDFYSFEEFETQQIKDFDAKIFKIIFRLINFYQPGNLVYSNQLVKRNINILRTAFPDVEFVEENEKKKVNKIDDFSFIIADNNIFGNFKTESLKNHSVLCLQNIDESCGLADFFQNLLFENEIQIVIKYGNFGIIIVNKKIPKQNYVIK